MSKIVSIVEKQIIDSVTSALRANMADGTFIEAEIPAFKTEIPADRKNGDYSANGAFMLSKALRMPPRKIAEEIASEIEKNDDEENELAGNLPNLNEGDALKLKSLKNEQKFTKPSPRYSEATLIKAMEENGISKLLSMKLK